MSYSSQPLFRYHTVASPPYMSTLLDYCHLCAATHVDLFTVIDRTSRWPEAIQLSSITTADCARALLASWISRFGLPSIITSDRGV
jgi:hypothetical protein